MDASHLTDKGEVRMLTDNPQDLEIAIPLMSMFDEVLAYEVNTHPVSDLSNFINASSRLADKGKQENAQDVVLVGPMPNERTPLSADKVTGFKQQLVTKGLVLAADGNTLNYTIADYIVILYPRDPQTESVIIHIVDASHLADKGEIRILNEMNDQEFETAKPLIEVFNKAVFDEVINHPDSKLSAFVRTSGLLDKVNM